MATPLESKQLQDVFAALTRETNEWVAVIDAEDRCTCSSASVNQLLGIEADEFVGRRFVKGLAPADIVRLTEAIAAVRADTEERRHARYSRPGASGEMLQVRTVFTASKHGLVEGVVATTSLDEPLDSGSRAGFLRSATKAVGGHDKYTILAIELTDLRRVAVGLGHRLARDLLEAVLVRASEASPQGGIVGLTGPYEIGVVLPAHSNRTESRKLAAALRKVLARPFSVGGHRIPLTTRIGFAFNETSEHTVADVLIEAESAAQRGRGRHTLTAQGFISDMRRADNRRLAIVSGLPKALSEHQLSLRYQPIVRLDTGAIAGFEALLRWNHPKLGEVSPGEFVPIAEELDLIAPLDHWALRTAAQTIASWTDVRPVYLSANLSARQLHDPALPAKIERVLAETGLPPKRVKLEITETALAAREELAMQILENLREVGVALVMDDFGTGYASLTQMARLPIDVVKIDRSLTMQLRDDPKVRAIIEGVRFISQQLGLAVVVEGVEEPGEASVLKKQRFVFAQGYLYGRPMQANAAHGMLQRENEQ